MRKKPFIWAAQILTAMIFFQSLYFKFTGSEISKELFNLLGIEPWGRYLVGIAELVIAIMLLIPANAAFGALLALLIGIAAIFTHVYVIGIYFGGNISLFFLSIAITAMSAFVTFFRRREIKEL